LILCCACHFYALDPFFLVFLWPPVGLRAIVTRFSSVVSCSAPGLRFPVQPEEQACEILSCSPSSFSSGYSRLSRHLHFSSPNPTDRAIVPDFPLQLGLESSVVVSQLRRHSGSLYLDPIFIFAFWSACRGCSCLRFPLAAWYSALAAGLVSILCTLFPAA
jgi:hypothetical protein